MIERSRQHHAPSVYTAQPRPLTARLADRILTPTQYAEHESIRAADRAYTYELQRGAKRISMFGTEHVRRPGDPLFASIDASYALARPDLVFVEGMEELTESKERMREHARMMSVEDAQREGENMYTLKLAVEHAAEAVSPEPRTKDEIAYLGSELFSRRDILAFYVFRQLSQYEWPEDEDTDAARSYLEPLLRRFRQDSGWEPATLEEHEREVLANAFVPARPNFKQAIDPIPQEGRRDTVLNEIAAKSSRYRDEHFLERIAQGLESRDRLFVVLGKGHAVTLEPALRALMEAH